MKKMVCLVGFFILVAAGSTASLAQQQPVIVDEIWIDCSGYGGGVAWREGKIYEGGSRDPIISIRNPINGAVEGHVTVPSNGWPIGIQGMTYDSKRDWLWFRYYGTAFYAIPAAGGAFQAQIGNGGDYRWGIFYDKTIDRLWIVDEKKGILKVNPEPPHQVEQTISLDFPAKGIVRVGDKFWIIESLENQRDAYLIECNMDGSQTGIFMKMPESAYEHDAGGICVDEDGFLWVRGGQGSAIYKVDIGYHPGPSPSPPLPATTPVGYKVLDSADYNGDGRSDVAVFRGASGLWAVRGITRVYFGAEGDIPVSGDYNGDGTTDPSFFRKESGLWAIKGITRAYFGSEGDIPVPGDYNGDGFCDMGIFRENVGLWAVRGVTRVYFGRDGDLPVPTYGYPEPNKLMAIFRPSTGEWLIKLSGAVLSNYYGRAGDYPIPADWDGAPGMKELGIFRPSTGLWAVQWTGRAYFGASGDQPVVGDYLGDGTDDAAIFRDTAGLWAIRHVSRLYFGRAGDIPVSTLAINPSSSSE